MGCDYCPYLRSFYGETKCTAPKSIKKYLCGADDEKIKGNKYTKPKKRRKRK